MGAVYIAVDQKFGSRVAIKETFYEDPDLAQAFAREARLLNSLHHPILPHVSDFFNEGGAQFLVMEYIEGEDLNDVLKREGSFPVADVVRWTTELLDGLDYLHSQDPPVIHRDIKPANLKLTLRGNVVLLDFGLAKETSGHTLGVKSVFGYSRRYSPLEQIEGVGTDARSDIFSLGATVFHLVTGNPPVDVLARASAIIAGRPDPIKLASELSEDVPLALANVINTALALNAEKRFVSARAMRTALEHAVDPDSPVHEEAAVIAATVADVAPVVTEPFPALQAFRAEVADEMAMLFTRRSVASKADTAMANEPAPIRREAASDLPTDSAVPAAPERTVEGERPADGAPPVVGGIENGPGEPVIDAVNDDADADIPAVKSFNADGKWKKIPGAEQMSAAPAQVAAAGTAAPEAELARKSAGTRRKAEIPLTSEPRRLRVLLNGRTGPSWVRPAAWASAIILLVIVLSYVIFRSTATDAAQPPAVAAEQSSAGQPETHEVSVESGPAVASSEPVNPAEEPKLAAPTNVKAAVPTKRPDTKPPVAAPVKKTEPKKAEVSEEPARREIRREVKPRRATNEASARTATRPRIVENRTTRQPSPVTSIESIFTGSNRRRP